MPVLKFDYLPDVIKDATGKVSGYIFRPKVNVKLGYAHQISRFSVDCLVDSGADYNLFPAGWGRLMGIPIEKGKYKKLYGIGRSELIAYRHNVLVYIGSHIISTTVDFNNDQTVPLLGRNGFFDRFRRVSFYDQQQYMKLDV